MHLRWLVEAAKMKVHAQLDKAWTCSGPQSVFRSWNPAQERELCPFFCAEYHKGGMCGGMGHIFRVSEDVPTNNSWGSCTVGVSSQHPHLIACPEPTWIQIKAWHEMMKISFWCLKNKVHSVQAGPCKQCLASRCFPKRSWDVTPQSSVLQVLAVPAGSWWSSSDLALCPTVLKDSLRAARVVLLSLDYFLFLPINRYFH